MTRRTTIEYEVGTFVRIHVPPNSIKDKYNKKVGVVTRYGVNSKGERGYKINFENREILFLFWDNELTPLLNGANAQYAKGLKRK
jgi:hypothetical protein